MIASPLSAVLANPERLAELSSAEWELLLRQARRTQLTARIAQTAIDCGIAGRLPPRPRDHLEAALRLAEWRHRTVRWEVDCVRRALSRTGVPVIILKGAAYVLAELPAAKGRIFGDIDIMVPRDRLDDVERALFAHGWHSQGLDAYDQRYYREWMHELPPLHHVRRHSVLDVHHTIAPLTARLPVDAAKLFEFARPIGVPGRFLMLAPPDMVLHSIIHLFQEGEFDHGLRDLIDIDDLMRHFGRDAMFWSELHDRAVEHRLGRPLYYAVEQAKRLFATPVPSDFSTAIDRFGPDSITRGIMNAVLRAGIAGEGIGGRVSFAAVSRWLLSLRGHYLRMPLRLLVPHLVRKGWRRRAAP